MAVDIKGDYTYTVAWNERLWIFDVSDPANPAEVAVYSNTYFPLAVTISGGYAYIADDEKGLKVLNVASPTHHSSAGSYSFPGGSGEIVISENIAFAVACCLPSVRSVQA